MWQVHIFCLRAAPKTSPKNSLTNSPKNSPVAVHLLVRLLVLVLSFRVLSLLSASRWVRLSGVVAPFFDLPQSLSGRGGGRNGHLISDSGGSRISGASVLFYKTFAW